jgi:hypothetical protein
MRGYILHIPANFLHIRANSLHIRARNLHVRGYFLHMRAKNLQMSLDFLLVPGGNLLVFAGNLMPPDGNLAIREERCSKAGEKPTGGTGGWTWFSPGVRPARRRLRRGRACIANPHRNSNRGVTEKCEEKV